MSYEVKLPYEVGQEIKGLKVLQNERGFYCSGNIILFPDKENNILIEEGDIINAIIKYCKPSYAFFEISKVVETKKSRMMANEKLTARVNYLRSFKFFEPSLAYDLSIDLVLLRRRWNKVVKLHQSFGVDSFPNDETKSVVRKFVTNSEKLTITDVDIVYRKSIAP